MKFYRLLISLKKKFTKLANIDSNKFHKKGPCKKKSWTDPCNKKKKGYERSKAQ